MTSLYSVSVLWTRFLFRFLHASLTISEKFELSTKKSVKVQEIAVDFFSWTEQTLITYTAGWHADRVSKHDHSKF